MFFAKRQLVTSPLANRTSRLLVQLRHDHWAVRERAIAALIDEGSEEAAPRLARLLRSKNSIAVIPSARVLVGMAKKSKTALANLLDEIKKLIKDSGDDDCAVHLLFPVALLAGLVGEITRAVSHLLLHDDPVVRYRALRLFHLLLPDDEVVDAFESGLSDADQYVRHEAVCALSRSVNRASHAIVKLRMMVDDPFSLTRVMVLKAIGIADVSLQEVHSFSIEDVLSHLSSPEYRVRRAAIKVIGRLGTNARSVAPALLEFLLKNPEPQFEVWNVLGKIGRNESSVVAKLVELLSHEDRQVRCTAAATLRSIGLEARSAIPRLINMLHPVHEKLETTGREIISANGTSGAVLMERMIAIRALAEIGKMDKEKVIPALRSLLKLENSSLRSLIYESLRDVGDSEGERSSDIDMSGDSDGYIVHTPQQDGQNCLLASIAMICGLEYEDVAALLPKKRGFFRASNPISLLNRLTAARWLGKVHGLRGVELHSISIEESPRLAIVRLPGSLFAKHAIVLAGKSVFDPNLDYSWDISAYPRRNWRVTVTFEREK